MTNDEVKKKIIDIITETLRWEPYYFISRGIVYENDLPKIADALIEAGIGDMKEAEHRAEVAERALKDCSKRLLVFTKSFGDGATEEEVYNKMIKIAEKELSEEEEDE